MTIQSLLLLCGLPTALTTAVVGLGVWLIKRKITQHEEERKKEEVERELKVIEREAERERKAIEREKNRENLMLLLIQNTRANTVLGQATARAVQRIPDAHCNGDMTSALKYVDEMQSKEKNFLINLGLHSIFENETEE